MADSSNNYVIRLVVDNSAAKAGFTDTSAAAAALGPALDRGIGTGARTADAAIQMVDRDAQKAIKTIQDMSATIGMTPVQKLAYRADQLGVGDVVAPDIGKLLDYEAAQRGVASSAQRGVASSAQQAAGAVNAFGETEEQASARIRQVAADAMASQAAMQATARATYDAALANQSLTKSSSDSSTTVAQQNQAMRDYATLQARQNAQAQELREGLKTGSGNYTELEAQYGRLDAAMAQGSLTAEEYESAFASLRKEEDNLARGLDSLRGRYDPLGVAQRRLAQDTKTLDDAFKNGQLSEKEYEAALSGIKVDQARLALASLAAQERELRQQLSDGTITNKAFKQSIADIGSAKEPLQAVVKNASSASEAVHEFGLQTASARREVLVLGHEMLTGNWSNFGGSLMVLGERMNVMEYALNPVVLGLAALAGAAYVVYEAIHSTTEANLKFNQSLVLTNNWAGVTNESTATLAKTISGDVGTSFTAARAAIDETVASGRVLGTDLQTVTEIALLMAKSTGESFDKALASVVKQADGVSQAAIDWEKSHHDMSQATLQHVEALDKAGDHTTALRILYDQELATMQAGTTTKVGAMTALWNGFLDQWGKFKRGLGGTQTLQDQRSTLVEQMNSGDTNPLGIHDDDYKKEIAAIDAQIAAQTKEKAKVDEVAAAKASLLEIDTKTIEQLKQGASNEEKRTTAIKAANDAYERRVALAKSAGFAGDALTSMTSGYASQRDRLIADAQRQYKDPKPPKEKAPQDDAATRMLESLRQEAAAMQEQLDSSEKLTDAARKRAEFEQRIADIKNKPVQTAADKSYLANQDDLRTQLDINVARAKALQLKQQDDKLTQRSAQINQSIADGQATRAENYQRTLGAFGQGKDQLAQVQAMNQIATEFQRYHEQLAKVKPKPDDLQGSADYVAEQAKIDAAMQHSLTVASDYYAQLKAKRADWKNGVTEVMADYQSSVEDHAGQAATALTDGLRSGEDAFANFAKTGKLSIAGVGDVFVEEVARMEYRLLASKVLKSDWVSQLLGLGASAIGNVFGTVATTASAATAASNVVSSGYSGVLSGPTSITSYAGSNGKYGSYDEGGFTGIGGKYDEAGVVHKGEFVFDKETTSKYRPLFESIHSGQFKSWRGYAEGGMVGGGRSGGLGISVPVNVVNEAGDVSQASATTTTGANGLPSIDVIVKRVQNGLAKNMRSGQGSLHAAISSRFGVRPKPGG